MWLVRDALDNLGLVGNGAAVSRLICAARCLLDVCKECVFGDVCVESEVGCRVRVYLSSGHGAVRGDVVDDTVGCRVRGYCW
jgi:hypothetical protein